MTDFERAYLAAIARACQLAPSHCRTGRASEEVGFLEQTWNSATSRLLVSEEEQDKITYEAWEQLCFDGYFIVGPSKPKP